MDEHPLLTVEELFTTVAGGETFSKLDLSQAYFQLEVRPEDRDLFILSTHRGLFCPTRLMYGVAYAPAMFQRLMEEILHGIPGVTVFIDDIRVIGPDTKMNLLRLEEVLNRLDKYGLRVNREKCDFFSDRIEYCGYMVDKQGTTNTNFAKRLTQYKTSLFLKIRIKYGLSLDSLTTMVDFSLTSVLFCTH